LEIPTAAFEGWVSVLEVLSSLGEALSNLGDGQDDGREHSDRLVPLGWRCAQPRDLRILLGLGPYVRATPETPAYHLRSDECGRLWGALRSGRRSWPSAPSTKPMRWCAWRGRPKVRCGEQPRVRRMGATGLQTALG